MNEVETSISLRPQNYYEEVSGSVVVGVDEERAAGVCQRRKAPNVVALGKKGRIVEVPQILRIRAEDSRVGEETLRFNFEFCVPHLFMLPDSPLGCPLLTQGA